MANISISRNHSLSTEDIKSKIDTLRAQLEVDYDIKSEWKNDSTLTLKGSGIKSGEVTFDTSSVNIDIKLGMMVSAFKGKIESKINSKLDELL